MRRYIVRTLFIVTFLSVIVITQGCATYYICNGTPCYPSSYVSYDSTTIIMPSVPTGTQTRPQTDLNYPDSGYYPYNRHYYGAGEGDDLFYEAGYLFPGYSDMHIFSVNSMRPGLLLQLGAMENLDLYVAKDRYPTPEDYDYARTGPTGAEILEIYDITAGRYYVMVYAPQDINETAYELKSVLYAVPSTYYSSSPSYYSSVSQTKIGTGYDGFSSTSMTSGSGSISSHTSSTSVTV